MSLTDVGAFMSGDGGARARADWDAEAKVRFRRNLKIGEWAAGRMGLDDAQGYARAVARSEGETPADEDVARKLARDLANSGLAEAAHDVPALMEEFLALARAEIEAESR